MSTKERLETGIAQLSEKVARPCCGDSQPFPTVLHPADEVIIDKFLRVSR